MAIRGDGTVVDEEIGLTCDVAATKGVVLVHKTDSFGSGVGLGDSAGVATLVANPSGYKPAGLLMQDVVTLDETQYHRNYHKVVAKIDERVNLLKKGWQVITGVVGSPNPGDTLYLSTNGVLTKTKSATGGLVATPPVGTARTTTDADGYTAVDFAIPVVVY